MRSAVFVVDRNGWEKITWIWVDEEVWVKVLK